MQSKLTYINTNMKKEWLRNKTTNSKELVDLEQGNGYITFTSV